MSEYKTNASRNLFVLIAVILLTGQTSIIYGQSNKIEVGVEGGAGMAMFLGKNIYYQDHYEPLVSGLGGAFLQVNCTKLFAIKTGLFYERKGAMVVFGAGMGEFNYRLDYMVIPFLLKGRFGNKIQFFFNSGPYFGYLLNDSYSGSWSDVISMEDEPGKKFDFGLSAGLGISIPIERIFEISLEVRDNFGFTDPKKTPYLHMSSDMLSSIPPEKMTQKSYNNTLNVIICFSVKLPGKKIK